MNKFVCLVALLVFSQIASGGWISSGGESLIYARNPWFVKNTLMVDYCLEMDEASFSISKAEVEKLIAETFEFWKSEFKINSDGVKTATGFAKIATQDFNYLSKCQKQTPLIFKLGLKTLDKDEIAELKDPKKFIGVTIRKDYSLVTLEGNGIIYITADRGSDAYTNNGQMVDEAWKSPTLLRYALMHEIGHFFGIAHVGSGIMSEVFMTVLLNKRMAPDFEKSSQLSFLNPQNNFEVCRETGAFHPDFFSVPRGTQCLKFEMVAGPDKQWNVARKDVATGSYEDIGVVQILSLDQSPFALKPAVVVQLPDEQKVFSPRETAMGPFLIGAVFSDTSFIGTFRPKGIVRAFPIQMSLSAEKISFVGTVNNQQVTVMNYSPLSFMRAIFPY